VPVGQELEGIARVLLAAASLAATSFRQSRRTSAVNVCKILVVIVA